MHNLELQKRFMEYSEARKNGLSKVKTIKKNGGRLVGTFCSFAPAEILDAAGIYSVNLCSTTDESIIDAEVDLPNNLCPLIKSSYGIAISGKHNYTYFSDIIIGETTCDGKKKMYELLGEVKDMYIMQLPQGIDRDYAPIMWVNEVHQLIKTLEEKFGVEIPEDKLKEATTFRNKLRASYCELFNLGRLQPPAISGFHMYKIIEGSKFSFDLEKQYTEMRAFIDQVKQSYDEGTRPIDKDAKRILITGCPVGGVLDTVIKTIESSGAVVVCFENCDGITPVRNMVDEETNDIVKAIADRYLNIGCSVMTPNLKRMEILPKLIEEFKVDAVIEVVLQTCHCYSVETRAIKHLVNDNDKPYMSIETDYSKSNMGQVKTRIMAFLEIL